MPEAAATASSDLVSRATSAKAKLAALSARLATLESHLATQGSPAPLQGPPNADAAAQSRFLARLAMIRTIAVQEEAQRKALEAENAKLREANAKLEYRVQHVLRALAAEETSRRRDNRQNVFDD